ncbi:MAG: DEAD/DEAH box helicase [Ferrovum sp.]|nr:DEAD/DEAH box helicase [Ferrovum sp.]
MICIDDVRQEMNLAGKGEVTASKSMVLLQEEGIAALCNILEKRQVAYLADEVGLGKTMQALGVIAMMRRKNPQARILIISPREIVQNGWQNEFANFRSSISIDSALNWKVVTRDNLHGWLSGGMPLCEVSLLRHTSFSRPAFVSSSMDRRQAWHAICEQWQPVLGDCLQKTVIPSGPKEEFSFECNMALADATVRRFGQEKVHFDLVIVDEAQCLRNKDNQTNNVLFRVFQNRVVNWLFMSATPTHSGVGNLPAVMNHYPCRKEEVIPKGPYRNDEGYSALMQALARHMVRRPRTYVVDDRTFSKPDYRNHDSQKLALRCDTTLSALTVALVQKKLVDIVYDPAVSTRPGFFRAGYLACFESLDGSLSGRHPEKLEEQGSEDEMLGDSESKTDFFQEQQHHTKHDAPDMGFVNTLSESFKNKGLGQHLPHPKIDKVVDDLALHAFGLPSQSIVGGRKTLVFCRRISSVYALQQRLMNRYIAGIEDRCKRVWGKVIDWENGHGLEMAVPADDSLNSAVQVDEANDDKSQAEAVDNLFRLACREKQWLHRFRSSFSDGNRNALFFEENWFARLCAEGGAELAEAMVRIPPSIMSSAFAHYAGYKRRMHRYIVWHCLKSHAGEVFGLDSNWQEFWLLVLRNIFSDEITGSSVSLIGQVKLRFASTALLDFRSFWTTVEENKAAVGISLPGTVGEQAAEKLYERQVLKTLLYRYMLLSDHLVDLYFACIQCPDEPVQAFFNWFSSSDVDAERLRKICREWISNRALIFRSAYAEKRPLAELARLESYDYLHAMEPVMAVVGGSGKRDRLLQQFNTPGMPFVVVCTDTLREGVNLHLFCDRVMHFGVAWTSGDLEQRIGRVDRYFSAIERSIELHVTQQRQDGELPKLDILYPHLRDTLEKRQVEVVLQRKDESERLMDSSLSIENHASSQDIGVDAYFGDAVRAVVHAKGEHPQFSAKRHLPAAKL